jgi:hypothetical protein
MNNLPQVTLTQKAWTLPIWPQVLTQSKLAINLTN